MPATITDADIATFLRRNAGEYPSQVSLIRAAVRVLWPEGPPEGAAERVVRACLGDGTRRAPEGRLLPVSTPPPA